MTRFALLGGLLALLAACAGSEPPPAALLEVLIPLADGPAPPGMRVERIASDAPAPETYPLVRLPGADRPLYEAPGAPEGDYRLRTPEGWWPIRTSALAIHLEPGGAAAVARVGRAHTLYVAGELPGMRLGPQWAAQALDADGALLEIESALEPGERLAVLRFAARDWRGRLRVIGRLAGERGEAGPLLEPLHFDATEDGRPLVGQMRPASPRPLEVVLVPGSPGVALDGVPVRCRIPDLPLETLREVPTRGGRARFAALAHLDLPLEVRVGEEPPLRVDPEDWVREAGLLVLHLPGASGRPVRLRPPGPDPVDRVQARPPGSDAYGVLAARLEAGVLHLRVPEGAVRILLRSGSRWSEAVLDAGAEEVRASPWREAVWIQGRVEGAEGGAVVHLRRVEEEAAVAAQGFSLRVSAFGEVEGQVPPGTYRLEVRDARGTWRRPTPLVAEEPGTRLRPVLRAPGGR